MSEIRAYFRVKTTKIYYLYTNYVKNKDQRIQGNMQVDVLEL